MKEKKRKEDLRDINKLITQGLISQPKATRIEKGEKTSKFFLGLESRNSLKKSVTRIMDSICTILDSQENIPKEVSKTVCKT